MFYIGILLAIIGIIALIISIIQYKIAEKTLININLMLDKAISGDFKVSLYDESMLSKTESKMTDFLSKSSLSMQSIKVEQERINSLISDISHQTKTPIANILLYSELLNEQALTVENQNLVKSITTQSEKLDFLIKSLIKTSRLENGIITVNPKTQNIIAMLSEAMATINLKAKNKNISIVFDNIHDEITADFDWKWTVEAVYNILDNAVKYTYADGEICVNVIEYEMFVRIDIADNGIGICEDELHKIFLRFYRSADSSEHYGVGIGLYLSRKIINAEGGYIKVKSNKGSGSV
ncbi:MAG TPA: HAMP domain-containing sensor histidine kinase, partial [Sedimentibacter sp.]|nr:HAMP domain-containing sensor histidine kinase [Sedimentibacter sp.]